MNQSRSVLRRINMVGGEIHVLRNTSLQDCRLVDMVLDSVQLNDVSFERTTLERLVFSKCRLSRVSFSHVRMKQVTLIDCWLTECEFVDIDLQDSANVEISECTLVDTSLEGLGVQYVNLDASRLNVYPAH